MYLDTIIVTFQRTNRPPAPSIHGVYSDSDEALAAMAEIEEHFAGKGYEIEHTGIGEFHAVEAGQGREYWVHNKPSRVNINLTRG